MSFITLLMSTLISVTPMMDEGNLEPVSDSHMLIHGFTVERVYGSENESNAPNTRCIVYKDDEIYVAFNSNEKGEYVFNLPIGNEYTLEFGGENYVNKRVILDVRGCLPKKRKEHIVEMDMALFRPVEGIDYADMEKPVVRWYYDKGEREIIPDFDVIDGMWRTVEKIYKKSEKLATK